MRPNPVLLLGLVTGVCAASSALLSVAFAANIFSATSSATRSALVFLVQYLPTAVLLRAIWRISEATVPGRLIAACCGASMVVTVVSGLGFTWDAAALMYITLAMRGLVESIIKQARGVYIKAACQPGAIGKANTTLTLFEFSGQALGAMSALFILPHLSVLSICILDAGMFLVGAVLALCLPRYDIRGSSETAGVSLGRVAATLVAMPQARTFFLHVVVVVVSLQAVNQTLRTWLPLQWLHKGLSFAGLTEAVALAGIVLGIVAARRLVRNDTTNENHLLLAAGAACLSLSAVFHVPGVGATLAAYLLYMSFFELWLAYALSSFLIRCPAEVTKPALALLYGVAFGGISATGLLVAAMSDQVGLDRVAGYVSAALLLFLMARAAGKFFFQRKVATQ
jgi:hypothetical protein